MPAVFRWQGYRFHFFSDEGDPREPIHIHVEKGDADAKFWLYPDVSLAYNHGFNGPALNALGRVIAERRPEIEDRWNEFFA